MTGKLRLTDTSDEVNAMVVGLLEQLEQKEARNLLRASYYDGRRAVRQVGTVIPPQYYRLAMVLGWCGKGVDLLSRRTNLDSMIWPDGDLVGLGIREVSEGNHLRTEMSSAFVSAYIHGVSFLINTTGGMGEPKALIHVKDALSATGTWNPRKRALDALLSITEREKDTGEPAAIALYLPGRTIVSDAASGWVAEETEHAWGMPVEPVVYKPRVGRPFGYSRISREAMSLQDSGLRTLARLEGHMDVYSFPEMWMLGADEAIFKNADGSPKAAWQVMLGRIKGIPDDEDATNPRADVKQFAASSPEPHLAMLNATAKMMARELSLPDTAMAITDIANPTSAESYDASQHELIAEAEGALDDFGPPVSRAVTRALAMLNQLESVPDEWATIAPKWRNPRFLSRAAEADAGVKQVSAVPWLADTEVGLELLGLDQQQIDRALAEKRRVNGSAALRAIAAAAQTGQSAVSDVGTDAAV